MAAARSLIRSSLVSRQSLFRLAVIARGQATSASPASTSGSATDMTFTFASPSEVTSRCSLVKNHIHLPPLLPVQVFYNQVKNVRQVDIPTMSGNMGILGTRTDTSTM